MQRPPRDEDPADVLVVGAGLAGAAAARSLADAGMRVRVLDKGRGPGGRLSSRRTPTGAFDHGAGVVQATTPAFRAWLEMETRAGRAAPWAGGWVGVPGMNALLAGLLDGLDVRWSAAVAALRREVAGWSALGADGTVIAMAPRLVLAVPAPQAVALLLTGGAGMAAEGLVEALGAVRYVPAWAALIEVEPGSPLGGPTKGHDGIVDTLHRQADKPGRADVGHWVLVATASWSEVHLEDSPDVISPKLSAAFIAATGIMDGAIRHVSAHRWRYARPLNPCDPAPFEGQGLFVAGDAFGPDDSGDLAPAERAWHSGMAAAARLRAEGQPKS